MDQSLGDCKRVTIMRIMIVGLFRGYTVLLPVFLGGSLWELVGISWYISNTIWVCLKMVVPCGNQTWLAGQSPFSSMIFPYTSIYIIIYIIIYIYNYIYTCGISHVLPYFLSFVVSFFPSHILLPGTGQL